MTHVLAVGLESFAMITHESLSKVAGFNVSSNLALQQLPAGDKEADVIFLLRSGKAKIPYILESLIVKKDSEGKEVFAHFLTPSGYYLRYESVEFVIDFEDEVRIYCYPKHVSRELIWSIFVSDVISYILEVEWINVLHSSAVVIDGNGVAFVGYPGSGKSTLAAYLLKAGFPLLADDRLPLAISKDKVWAIPNFPGIRISEDACKLFFGNIVEKLPRVHSKSEKRFFYFGASGHESGFGFQKEPVILKRIYVLKPDSAEISTGSLSPKKAFFSLVPHIFDSNKPTKILFHDKCALAQFTQVRQLSFPRSFNALPAVLDIIKNECKDDLLRDEKVAS